MNIFKISIGTYTRAGKFIEQDSFFKKTTSNWTEVHNFYQDKFKDMNNISVNVQEITELVSEVIVPTHKPTTSQVVNIHSYINVDDELKVELANLASLDNTFRSTKSKLEDKIKKFIVEQKPSTAKFSNFKITNLLQTSAQTGYIEYSGVVSISEHEIKDTL